MSDRSGPSTSSAPVADTPTIPMPSEWLVALLTPPVLLATLGAQSLGDLLKSVGQASEEVFRGDRLPILNFPQEQEGVGEGATNRVSG